MIEDIRFWICAIALIAVFTYIILSYNDDPYDL